MNLDQLIMDARGERDQLKEIIGNLERLTGLVSPNETVAKRPGRKSMDKAAREEVSGRMKRYWSRQHATRNSSP